MERNWDEISEKLEVEIEETKKLIEEYKESTQPVVLDNTIGRLSRMDAIMNKSVREASMRQAVDKLSKLTFVLSKVGKSEFGICRNCKKPIPIERIMAIPESMYCVHCSQ